MRECWIELDESNKIRREDESQKSKDNNGVLQRSGIPQDSEVRRLRLVHGVFGGTQR
jgi:hypothetical protein